MIINLEEFKRTSYAEWYKETLDQFNEGLITTYPVELFIKHLWACLNQKNYLYTTYRDKYEHKMKFEIFITDEFTYNDVLDLNHASMLYGYRIIMLVHNGKEYKGIEKLPKNIIFDAITVIFEPNKDDSKNVLYTAYHVTNELNIDKIMKIGIVPRSGSKLSYHPDRIYVCKDKETCKKLIPEMRESSKYYNRDEKGNKTTLNETYVLLEISNASDLVFYGDPNFMNNGYFTYSNIDPKNIKIIETIYKDEN